MKTTWHGIIIEEEVETRGDTGGRDIPTRRTGGGSKAATGRITTRVPGLGSTWLMELSLVMSYDPVVGSLITTLFTTCPHLHPLSKATALSMTDQVQAKKLLSGLSKREDLGNKVCCDCENPNPQWASLRSVRNEDLSLEKALIPATALLSSSAYNAPALIVALESISG